MATPSSTTPAPAEPRARKGFSLPPEAGVAVVLMLAFAGLSAAYPDFRTGANVSVILSGASEVAILAAGMTLVIATGGIDVSVGSVVGLCSIVLGKVAVEAGWPLYYAVTAVLAVGAGCGLVNGVLIARFKVPPIIATLAMYSAARAGAYVLSHGETISGLPDSLTPLGYDSWMGLPIRAWVAIGALLVAAIILKRTGFGRGVLALGGSREAAHLSGIRVQRTEMLVYTFCGLLSALCAIVVTARGTAIPDAGKFLEMRAITAVVMGGTPVIGGSATMFGTLLGILTIGVVQNGVTTSGRDAIWEMLVLALVLLIAVEADRLRRSAAARRSSH